MATKRRKIIIGLCAVLVLVVGVVWKSSTRSEEVPRFDSDGVAQRFALRALSDELKRQPKTNEVVVRWQIKRANTTSYGDSSVTFNRSNGVLMTHYFHEPDPTSWRIIGKPPFLARVQTIFTFWNAPILMNIHENDVHYAALKKMSLADWCDENLHGKRKLTRAPRSFRP